MIKRFLIRSMVFFLTGVLLILLFFFTNKAFLHHSGILSFPASKTILILGDSHTETSINDSLLGNCVNLSASADSYYYSYLKLVKLKKINPQIKTLILSYSFKNIISGIEDKWLFNNKQINSRFFRFCHFMSLDDFRILAGKKPLQVMQNVFKIPRFSFIFFVSDYKSLGIGGFKRIERHDFENAIRNLQSEKPDSTFEYSIIEMTYLKKIFSFCKAREIELVLISTPLHPILLKARKKRMLFSQNYLQKHFSQVKYMDFSSMRVPDSCFADLNHMNSKGASLFSNHLREYLKE